MQPPFFSWLNHVKPQHFCPCGTSPRPPEMVTPVIFAPFPRCELIEQAKGCFERVIYQVKWRFYGDVVGIKWDMYGDISYISNNTIHNIRVYGIYIYIHMYDRSIYFAFLGFSCLKTEKKTLYMIIQWSANTSNMLPCWAVGWLSVSLPGFERVQRLHQRPLWRRGQRWRQLDEHRWQKHGILRDLNQLKWWSNMVS